MTPTTPPASSTTKRPSPTSSIQELTARNGRVIAIAIEGHEEIQHLVVHTIPLPQAPQLRLPLLQLLHLQLLSHPPHQRPQVRKAPLQHPASRKPPPATAASSPSPSKATKRSSTWTNTPSRSPRPPNSSSPS